MLVLYLFDIKGKSMQQLFILHVRQANFKSEVRRAKMGIRPQLLKGWQWRFSGRLLQYRHIPYENTYNSISERDVFYDAGSLFEVYRLCEGYESSSEWLVTRDDLALLKLMFSEVAYIAYDPYKYPQPYSTNSFSCKMFF